MSTVHLSLCLHCFSAEINEHCKVKTKCTIRIPSANYSVVTVHVKMFSVMKERGCKNFILRSDVLDPPKGYLVSGNLTIGVVIQVYTNDSPF
jgi:hypothetical protein